MDNQSLIPRIKQWLNDRGISDEVIRARGISWDGNKIVIPVLNSESKTVFNKYRRDPLSEIGPKYLYDPGARSTLYVSCLEKDVKKINKIIICEGELDALLLSSKGYFAVTSTGGAGTFKEEWKEEFEGLGRKMYVIYDNDKAGREGAVKVCRIIPEAYYVPLPPDVGDHGDVTDYFKTHTIEEFETLLSVCEPLPPLPPEPKKRKIRTSHKDGTDLQKAKEYDIREIVGVKSFGFMRCPIHNEKTASLKIYPNNRWHCYGCGKGGDTVDFLMERDKLTMKEAIKKILNF